MHTHHKTPNYLSNPILIMRDPSILKQEFLKKWIMGLQICNSPREMSLLERKNAIKVSADVAMASTRDPTKCWSRALIADATKEDSNKALIEQIVGLEYEKVKKVYRGSVTRHKALQCKKILRRSVKMGRVSKRVAKSTRVQASLIAKRLMQKRTQMLKSLVPGGETMDEYSLIEETLDYIVSLRAQVDVMQRLANAPKVSNLM